MNATRDSRTAHWASTVGCVLTVLACILIVHPVLEAGFSDDYSYIYTAKRAAETGRLIYNGWATTSLGIQVYLGALFVRIFGFSFTAVRAVCWVLSLANVALLHRLFLRVTSRNLNAVLAALTISLAPITFSTSLVFFTDLPAMFALDVTLYCCVRAMQAQADISIRRWLILAAVLSLVLGSVRQTAWGAALTVIPMTGWRLRGRPGILRLTIFLEAIGICVVGGALLWLKHAPYMVHEALFLPNSRGKLLILPFLPVVLLLELLPLLVGLVSMQDLRKRRTTFAAVAVAAAFVPWIAYSPNSAPAFLVDTYLQTPVPYTRVLGGALILLTVFLATITATIAIRALRGVPPASGRGTGVGFRDLFLITAPYFVTILVLIETRLSAWPRYVMALEPIAAVWLLSLHDEHSGSTRFQMPAFVTAAICCTFGVILAHDEFQVPLLTLKLERWAEASGLPRDQVEVGMEADGWFEISHGHTIHDPRILLPAGASTQRQVSSEQRACHYPWLSLYPELHPVYAVTSGPSPCYEAEPVHAETQHFWLRPAVTHYIYRFVPAQQMP